MRQICVRRERPLPEHHPSRLTASQLRGVRALRDSPRAITTATRSCGGQDLEEIKTALGGGEVVLVPFHRGSRWCRKKKADS